MEPCNILLLRMYMYTKVIAISALYSSYDFDLGNDLANVAVVKHIHGAV